MSRSGRLAAEAPEAARRPSAFEILGSLPIEVEGYRLERLEQRVSSGWGRPTTVVVLIGAGGEGRGEDVTYDAQDHDRLAAAPLLPHVHVMPGHTGYLTLTLRPGRYVLACDLPGHYEAGQYADIRATWRCELRPADAVITMLDG